jgi:hypothetical protein
VEEPAEKDKKIPGWVCDDCGAQGRLEVKAGESWASLIDKTLDAHEAASPDCEAPLYELCGLNDEKKRAFISAQLLAQGLCNCFSWKYLDPKRHREDCCYRTTVEKGLSEQKSMSTI